MDISGELTPIDTVLKAAYSRKQLALNGVLTIASEMEGVVSRDFEYDYYSGSYEAVSNSEEDIVLETEGKVLDEDVVVKKLRTYETSNPSGGTTIYIP